MSKAADRWPDEGTSQPHREQDAEHADEWRNEEHSDGWWKSSASDGWRKPLGEQTSSISGWWGSTETETPWQSEEPVGGFEVNNIDAKNMPKCITHDEWGQEWMMLNYDSGAAVTALLVSVAGHLSLEKRGEFRVASRRSRRTRAELRGQFVDTSRKWPSLC